MLEVIGSQLPLYAIKTWSLLFLAYILFRCNLHGLTEYDRLAGGIDVFFKEG
jgi:hypothetical protein